MRVAFSPRVRNGVRNCGGICKCTRFGATDREASCQWAQAATERHYEYIAITDHSKGLKIAGGIDEAALAKQAVEIAETNQTMRGTGITVLRSIEMNLNARAAGDVDRKALAHLDRFAPRRIKPSAMSRPCAIRTSKFSDTHAAGFITTGLG
jgi:hypothetical protein